MKSYKSPKMKISRFSEEIIAASANTPIPPAGNTPENKFEDGGVVVTIPDITFPEN